MAQLYRQHVLKEEAPSVVQIQGLKGLVEKSAEQHRASRPRGPSDHAALFVSPKCF